MTVRPNWLEEFVNEVCVHLHAVDDAPSLGCHASQADDLWEVTLFFSPTETIGGVRDGERTPCLYLVDVMTLLQVFETVDTASWQPLPLGPEDDLKSHFAIVGTYAGHPVWLRVLAETPEQIEPGRFLDHQSGRILNSW